MYVDNKFPGKVLVKKSSWSEHTWSTFISRAEEETEPELLGAQLLSQFQKDKFVHFFYHVLDLNMDHVISQVCWSSGAHYSIWGQIFFF